MQSANELSQERIKEKLGPTTLWRKVVYLPTTGSTNDVAKNLAAQGSPEGTVVMADEQTAGRGRMGRGWLAPPATCLLCSILLRPTLPPIQAQRLTMLCALAAADAVEESAGLRVYLKWPNDLVVKAQSPKPKAQNWRKLAGVLTETGVTGEQLEFVIVGIGINVNVEPERLSTLAPAATSILTERGRPVDRVTLLIALLSGVEQRYTALRAGENPHQEWAARLATLGQPVKATTSAGVLTGVAESVDEDGALLLRTMDGALHRLAAGDVTLTRSGATHFCRQSACSTVQSTASTTASTRGGARSRLLDKIAEMARDKCVAPYD
ncbi:MAG: biotin--[acetyl-CoA-carboxylase] ligase [Chloroflexota bacterium]|nr:biotin--[acetyl-CoA-carboxylase] ligase [Chloroflexota bacterium]